MSSIHIGIGHDDDLVISKLLYIEVLMDTCSKCGDHGFDFFISKDSVYSCLLNIKDLTSEWKYGLCCS